MRLTRRDAIKGVGATAGVAATGGHVLAVGEYEDDERDPDERNSVERLDGQTGDAPPNAIRAGHFSPDASAVDVLLDHERIASDLTFGDVSPYLEIEGRRHDVTITPAGDPDTVLWERDFYMADSFHSVFVVGSVENDTIRGYVPRDVGSALLRFVHGADGTQRVDVAAEEIGIGSNVRFNRSTDYVAVPGGSRTVSLSATAGGESLASTEASLEQGRAYTAIAVDDDGVEIRLVEDGPLADQ